MELATTTLGFQALFIWHLAFFMQMLVIAGVVFIPIYYITCKLFGGINNL